MLSGESLESVKAEAIRNKPPPSKEIILEIVKKTKKNEPRIFPLLLMVDKEAFTD